MRFNHVEIFGDIYVELWDQNHDSIGFKREKKCENLEVVSTDNYFFSKWKQL